jgi:hypothetical protein
MLMRLWPWVIGVAALLITVKIATNVAASLAFGWSVPGSVLPRRSSRTDITCLCRAVLACDGQCSLLVWSYTLCYTRPDTHSLNGSAFIPGVGRGERHGVRGISASRLRAPRIFCSIAVMSKTWLQRRVLEVLTDHHEHIAARLHAEDQTLSSGSFC